MWQVNTFEIHLQSWRIILIIEHSRIPGPTQTDNQGPAVYSDWFFAFWATENGSKTLLFSNLDSGRYVRPGRVTDSCFASLHPFGSTANAAAVAMRDVGRNFKDI